MVDNCLISFEKVKCLYELIYCMYNCSLDMIIFCWTKFSSLKLVIHRFHNNSAEDFWFKCPRQNKNIDWLLKQVFEILTWIKSNSKVWTLSHSFKILVWQDHSLRLANHCRMKDSICVVVSFCVPRESSYKFA